MFFTTSHLSSLFNITLTPVSYSSPSIATSTFILLIVTFIDILPLTSTRTSRTIYNVVSRQLFGTLTSIFQGCHVLNPELVSFMVSFTGGKADEAQTS